MASSSPSCDIDYHLQRARVERNIAYRSGDPVAADAHMRLSALHLGRALLLQSVRRAPIGNVHPFSPTPRAAASPVVALPVLELPAAR